jgi:cappuccino protein
LEEFCGLLEMIRTDNNICLEQVLKKVHEKSLIMDQIYHKIDKLQEFVEIVKKSVDDMEEEVTKAEQLFGNNNKVKKFLSSFISSSSSKPSTSQRKAKYEPKDIFITSDYIKSCDSETDQNVSQLTNNE